MPLNPLPEPGGKLLRLQRFACGILMFLVLFPTLLAFNLLQTATLVIKLFSQRAFRKTNRWMANIWWGWCTFGAEKIYRVQFVMSGDDVPERENAVVVLNHQEMADITVMFTFARSKKRLGDLKWFVKDVIKHVPGVGWGMRFLDCLFIKRNWTEDRATIHRVFDKILKYRVPIWLMLFAEGTRVTPEKVARSRAYAKKKGHKPLDHLLLPRTKGFSATIEALRGHLDAVYDVTIGYVDGVPTLWQWIKGSVGKVYVHVRRYGIEEMPEQDQALDSWLVARYEEKDALLEDYYRRGAFPAEGNRGQTTI